MSERNKRLAIAVGAAIAIACLMLWIANQLGGGASVNPPATTPAQAPAPAKAPVSSSDELERHHINRDERLLLDAHDVSGAESLHVTLEFPDAWRGETPRPVRVVSGDGRAIEVIASMEAAGEELIEVEIATSDLTPGPYMIEIKSAERTPLPLRRFVFEVR